MKSTMSLTNSSSELGLMTPYVYFTDGVFWKKEKKREESEDREVEVEVQRNLKRGSLLRLLRHPRTRRCSKDGPAAWSWKLEASLI
jgi:hypothetical protein